MRSARTLPIAIGLSFILPSGIADATSTTCATSTVCAEYINSSSGVAIHGEANNGVGVRGTSNGSIGFYGATAADTSSEPSGVEGETLTQTGIGTAGGFGLTAATGGAAPAYGILGYGIDEGISGGTAGAGNGSNGVPTSFGVFGFDPGGIAASHDTNVAVLGETQHGTAMLALSHPGDSNATDGFTVPYGIAAEGEPEQSGGIAVAVAAASDSIPVEAYNRTNMEHVDLAASGYEVVGSGFSVDLNGEARAASLTTNNGTYIRTIGSSGAVRIAASARTAAPVIEDSGEGRLVNGRGYVKLDPALADVIDQRFVYRVFLTAEGDSNVLYVSRKSPAGFLVSESRGGHSTISFDYRLVAKPFDDDEQRLALTSPHRKQGARLRQDRTAHPTLPLNPFARLHSPLGRAASSRELKAVADSTSCDTSVVCAEFINTSSGVAIHGEANTGIGIRGTSNSSTGFYGASRSGSTFFPGVEGESLKQTSDDVAGAFGLNAINGGQAPGCGVCATGSVYGIYGDAAGPGNGSEDVPTSVGVIGYDAAGVPGGDANVGVEGLSADGTAMLALSVATTSNSEVYDDSAPYGLAAEAEPDQTNGDAIGIEAVSEATPIEAYNPQSGDVSLATPGYHIIAGAFSVDDAGNIDAPSFETSTRSYIRTTGSSGTARIAYATRSAAPVLEDSGEGRVVNGRGYVRLDPALFDVIDKRSAYRVYLTPEGDSDGLYVTQKSPTGFMVREARGSHSTLSFDYRIIATPIGDNEQGLALALTASASESALRRSASSRCASGDVATAARPVRPLTGACRTGRVRARTQSREENRDRPLRSRRFRG